MGHEAGVQCQCRCSRSGRAERHGRGHHWMSQALPSIMGLSGTVSHAGTSENIVNGHRVGGRSLRHGAHAAIWAAAPEDTCLPVSLPGHTLAGVTESTCVGGSLCTVVLFLPHLGIVLLMSEFGKKERIYLFKSYTDLE